MSPMTLPEQQERTALEHSSALPAHGPGDRDVRAQRKSLLSILLDRRLILRFVNGVALAAMDLVLLFASLMIALRVKTVFTSDSTTLRESYDYAIDVLPFAALAMLLLFSGDGLYRPRNLRPGSARIMGSLFKVT